MREGSLVERSLITLLYFLGCLALATEAVPPYLFTSVLTFVRLPKWADLYVRTAVISYILMFVRQQKWANLYVRTDVRTSAEMGKSVRPYYR